MPSLKQKIAYWETQLLDLSRRNRLLNCTETRRGFLLIRQPEMHTLYRQLVQEEKKLAFTRHVTPAIDARVYSLLQLMRSAGAPFTVTLGDVQSSQTVEEQTRTLRALRNKARLAHDEQGQNLLYLAFGFVRWYDREHGSSVMNSPLLLVPVSLSHTAPADPCCIQLLDDDIVVNPTLAHYFADRFQFQFPAFDPEHDVPADYFATLRERFAPHGWELAEECRLGIFSFQKINMYRDLVDNAARVMDNPVLRAMYGERQAPVDATAEDHDAANPGEVCQIVSADSSQQDAIARSRRGESFVLQGPPGTGKSQTITNIIAQALWDGKSVLFVSEKMAALQVVHSRLVQAGLGDFCLPLHDPKANKREILQMIGAALEKPPVTAAHGEAGLLTLYARLREKLNRYPRQLHAVRQPLNISLYDAFGELLTMEDTPTVLLTGVPLTDMDDVRLAEITESLQRVAAAEAALTVPIDENPWRDYRTELFPAANRQHALQLAGELARCGETILVSVSDAANHLSWQILPEPAALHDALDVSAGILALPLLPPAWADMPAAECRARLQSFCQLAADHSAALTELSSCTPAMPDPAAVLEAYADVPRLWQLLQSAGMDMEDPARNSSRLGAVQDQLGAWLSAWCSALPEIWSEQQTLSAARPVWEAARLLDAMPCFSSGWLNARQRREALRKARSLSAHDSARRAALERATALIPGFADDPAAASALFEQAVAEMSSQAAGDLCPTPVQQMLAQSCASASESPFTALPTLNAGAWLREAVQLLPESTGDAALPGETLPPLRRLRQQLEKLQTVCSHLPPVIPQSTLADHQRIRHAFRKIAEAGLFPVRWLASRHRDEAALALQGILQKKAACDARRDALLKDYDPALLRINAASLLLRFRADHTSFLRFLNPQYHHDVRLVSACRRDGARISDAEITRVLSEVVALNTLSDELDGLIRQKQGLFLDEEVTVLSDWTQLQTRLELLSAPEIAPLLERLHDADVRHLSALMPVCSLTAEAPAEDVISGLAAHCTHLPADFADTIALDALIAMLDSRIGALSRADRLFGMLRPWLRAEVRQPEVVAAMRRLADVQDSGVALCLQLMEDYFRADQAFLADSDGAEELLQPLWQGHDTDWPALLHTLETLDDSRCGPLLEKLQRVISQPGSDAFRAALHTLAAHPPAPVIEAVGSLLPDADALSALDAAIRISEVHQAIDDLTALTRQSAPLFTQPVSGNAAARRLLLLYRWAECEGESVRSAAMQQKLAGPMYSGWQTDWSALLEACDTLDELLRRSPRANLHARPWRALFHSDDRSCLAAWRETLARNLRDFTALSDTFRSFFAGGWEDLPFPETLRRIREAAASPALLEQWQQHVLSMQSAAACGLSDVMRSLRGSGVPGSAYARAFRKGFLLSWIGMQLCDAPDVSAFTAADFAAEIAAFQQQDDRYCALSRGRLLNALTGRLPRASGAASGELATLTHEMNKKTRIMPIRKLFRQIPYLLQALKPCLMMSPLSVSQFLDADFYHFDMVIFDEASQIFPQDAIGAILRSKQAIIAGDEKQMPPSNFFAAAVDEPEEELFPEDDEAADDTPLGDSILEEAMLTLPRTSLLWHYRSRDEKLIAFSNQHYYHNTLYTFPNNNIGQPDMGVEYIHVEDGVYENRRNRREAEACVEQIFRHFRQFPDRSLGVVAFSEQQQAEIEDLLWERREEHPEFNAFFDEDRPEPFFIKNLENVQGDERDTIIFSICYARAANGRMRLNFGPLSKSGGERRLNVAVTRARCNVKLIGSILPNDIDLNRAQSEGARLLRAYITYAMEGAAPHSSGSAPLAEDRFADTVAAFLEEHGYAVTRSVGRSAYRVDLAVHSRTGDAAYLAGVLLDGPQYAAARTARDRDVIRRRMLNALGWSLVDCWSADWAERPESARAALLTHLQEIEQGVVPPAPPLPDPDPLPEEPPIAPADPAPAPQPNALTLQEYIPALPSDCMRLCPPTTQPNPHRLQQAVLHCISVEQPLHIHVLCQRMAPLMRRTKVTPVVRIAVEQAITALRGAHVDQDGDFLRIAGSAGVLPRKAGGREIDQISCVELCEVMKLLLASSYGLSRDEVCSETARLLGYARTGAKIETHLLEALLVLEAKGLVTIVHDKVQWKGDPR